MNVLHVYRTYFPDTQGGLEETIRQICRSTTERGVTNCVLTLSKNPTPQVLQTSETTVHRAKWTAEVASCSFSREAFSMFKKLSQDADVIHYHYPWPFADMLHLRSGKSTPSVVTYHSDIVRQRVLGKIYQPLRNRFLGSVDRIVCTSPNYFATSDVLAKFENKVDIVPIGLDETSYPAVQETTLQDLEEEFGRDFFLFVGVLRYYKGLHILLEAMAKAPYRVLIVGSGPTELELKRQAEELKLDNVVFTGYVSDEVKVGLFHLSKAIVFPSYLRAEAFGVTLLEGAMYGKPLISTEVGSGMSHININGETGIVVPPGSPTTLREAMDQLHFRPDMAKLMGSRARKRFLKLFTGSLMAERYMEIYQQLSGKPEASMEMGDQTDNKTDLANIKEPTN